MQQRMFFTSSSCGSVFSSFSTAVFKALPHLDISGNSVNSEKNCSNQLKSLISEESVKRKSSQGIANDNPVSP